MKYVIQNIDGLTFWSNEDGWVSFPNATRFDQSEKLQCNLPFEGNWVAEELVRYVFIGTYEIVVVIHGDGGECGGQVFSNITHLEEDNGEAEWRLGRLHGIEEMILQMAIAGCDIQSQQFQNASFAAIEAVANKF